MEFLNAFFLHQSYLKDGDSFLVMLLYDMEKKSIETMKESFYLNTLLSQGRHMHGNDSQGESSYVKNEKQNRSEKKSLSIRKTMMGCSIHIY